MKKRLLIVDDQVMLLDVLERQFANDAEFELAGVAKEAGTALDLASRVSMDVVMLDIDLGGGQSGFDVLSSLRAGDASRASPLRIVMVSMFENPMYRNRAFNLGADAYVTKGVRFQTLRALLLDDLSYEVPACDVGRFWRNTPQQLSSDAAKKWRQLSDRERLVVTGIADGALEKELADQLGISLPSVSTYLRRGMAKLGISTRAELIGKRLALSN